MSADIIDVTDADFDQVVLASDKPVLVDFWAEWCAPCKAIGPVLEEVAPDFDGRLQIVKMDIGNNPNTAPKFGIRQVPTLLIFKNGAVHQTMVGWQGKESLLEFIDASLAS